MQTEVLVENGGTVVIGGIYEQFERNRVNKVPLLGDIPYLGYLFMNTSRNERPHRAAGLPDAARRHRRRCRALIPRSRPMRFDPMTRLLRRARSRSAR